VIVDEAGSEEDVSAGDHRVVAWSAGDGHLQAALEPTGYGFGFDGFTGLPDGRVVVPTVFLQPAVMVLRGVGT
jgi:hypothetical protein